MARRQDSRAAQKRPRRGRHEPERKSHLRVPRKTDSPATTSRTTCTQRTPKNQTPRASRKHLHVLELSVKTLPPRTSIMFRVSGGINKRASQFPPLPLSRLFSGLTKQTISQNRIGREGGRERVRRPSPTQGGRVDGQADRLHPCRLKVREVPDLHLQTPGS